MASSYPLWSMWFSYGEEQTSLWFPVFRYSKTKQQEQLPSLVGEHQSELFFTNVAGSVWGSLLSSITACSCPRPSLCPSQLTSKPSLALTLTKDCLNQLQAEQDYLLRMESGLTAEFNLISRTFPTWVYNPGICWSALAKAPTSALAGAKEASNSSELSCLVFFVYNHKNHTRSGLRQKSSKQKWKNSQF